MFCESGRKVPNRIKRGKVILTAACMLTIVVLGITLGIFGSSKGFVNASAVKGFGIGIYWNQACTNRTSSIDWGLIQADSNNTITIYIKNEGNTPASLSLETSNWTPSIALRYMSLNWNYSGQVLRADQVIPLEIALTISPTIYGITNFSFIIIITASER